MTNSRPHARTLLFVLFLIAVSPCRAAEEPQDVSAELAAVAKQHKVHGLAVAVVEGGQLTKLGATGIRANGHEAKVTVDDLWHLGSCTKAMTATLCARLVERGLLRWDMTVGESFANDVARVHSDLQKVTLEQLLSHRAGLPANPPPTVMRKMLASGEGRAARELLVSDGILEKGLEHQPDTKFLYSNFGFMLAGMMAERATDKEWETLMREELFEPLGMKSAGFGPPGSADVVDQPRGHGFFGNALPPGPQADNPRGLGPAGTVHCSMADWSKFVALHLQAARGESRLLKRESFQKLHAPRGNDKDLYALGWIVADRPWADGLVLMHNGSNTRWFVVTWLAPKRNMAFLAACNVGPAAGGTATDAAVVLMLQQAGLLPEVPATAPPAGSSAKPIELASRRELFVDRLLIDKLTDCRLELNPPRDEGVVLKLDQPWEGPQSGYSTVIKVGERFLMYYRGVSQLGLDGSPHERTCVAESRDGHTWTKPELGLFTVPMREGKANNVVLADQPPFAHNFCPMLDTRPGVAQAERFKALAGTGDSGLVAFVSADGFRWQRLRDKPVISAEHATFQFVHMFDSQNLAFWSEPEQRYVCYFRVWDGVLRRIARSTSTDFISWSPAQLMEQVHDDGSGPQPAPAEQLYTNQTSPYFRAPHISIATAARFFPDRQVLTKEQAEQIGVNPQFFQDTSDSVFMTTRGGHVYDRTFLEGYMKPGLGARNWVSRTNYPALNVVPTGPTEMSLYVNHDYAQPTAHLRRYSLRLDGFASVRAGHKGGELLTKPITFAGEKLFLNFATSAAGNIRVEVQDGATGQPIPGFSLVDCSQTIGNEIERAVRWKSDPKLSDLAGKPVRLRIALHDADLFAFRFGAESE